jgi:ketosteroid isomerase-like protein
MRVKSQGQPMSFRLRFTDVYRKSDGRWQTVAWHATRLPEA